jgi:hypothetical protein
MARPSWMTGKDIRDATESVTINIRQRDIIGAEASNGSECVAARCTLRALDANAVYFYRSKAYVQWDDEGVIERYQLSTPLIRNVVEVLDDPHRSNDEILPGRYELKPPPPGQRLGLSRVAKTPGVRAGRKDRGHHVMGRVNAARHA